MENRLDKFKETSRLTTITKQLINNIKQQDNKTTI